MTRTKAAPKPDACPSCGRLADPRAGPRNFCPECGTDLRGGRRRGRRAQEDLVGDRYRLVAPLGEGGMGAVYRAEHVRMGKALAVKILRGDFARDPDAVERFRAEARIVSRLSHPNTIGVYDFGELDGGEGFYLAMEYVPGRDLAAVLREEGRLPEERAVAIAVQVLGSLAEAHEAGIVHRDVKPVNVMVAPARGGELVKVLDFGVAKLREEGAPDRDPAGAGAILGTPAYLAPELARGEPVDGRADLYAVGCLLHELVAGRPPFEAPSPAAVVAAHLDAPPPSLAARAPGVSRRLAAVVERALAKRPADRFPTADAMRDALLGAGGGAGRRRRSRARPALALLLALAVAAAAWRWEEAYGLLADHAPALAARVPAALRPAGDARLPVGAPPAAGARAER